MPYQLADTIAAIASPAGGAARGIVRISGPSAVPAALAPFRPGERPEIHFDAPSACAGQLWLESLKCELPATLLLWPTARSYTREPAAELHSLGSPPLLAAIVAELSRQGVRLAEPGEFTLRAFLAGRIDLTQAEAVLGIIDARGRSELEARWPKWPAAWHGRWRCCASNCWISWPNLKRVSTSSRNDIQFITPAQVEVLLAAASARVEALAGQLAGRGRHRQRLAVLIGPPNAGKSSLFNALARAVPWQSARHDPRLSSRAARSGRDDLRPGRHGGN